MYKPRSDLVDSIICGGILIRAISVLDDALIAYIIDKEIQINAKYPKLFHRLKKLNELDALINYDDIDKWRNRRNDVGHKTDLFYTWEEVEKCFKSVYRELSNLEIIKKFPNLEIKKISQRLPNEQTGHNIEIEHTIKIYDDEKTYREYKSRSYSG